MSSKGVSSSSQLPPLPTLTVLRETYCSQEMTDTALCYLWSNKPDLVARQIALEHLNFDQTYLKELARIIDFFRKEASHKIDIPETRLGMLDLLFELSRRMRKIRGIPEWKITGKPLAEGLDAPMPELSSLPIKLLNSGKGPRGITQEKADRIIDAAYRKRPELFYEFAEVLRRGSISHETFTELKKVLIQVSTPEDGMVSSSASTLGGEVNRRIRKMCDLPIIIHTGDKK